MFILFFLFLIHFFVGQLIEITKNKFLGYSSNIILLAVVMYLTLGIQDTADMEMYEYFYDSDWEAIDPMFLALREIFTSMKLEFYSFYQFHLIVYTLTYFFLISRYTKNIFYVFLVFFILYYVPYVNQFRYYLAFPFYLLSVHYFIVNRKMIYFILFTFLSLTSHSAILLLYAFIPAYYYFSTKYYFRMLMIGAGLLFVLMAVLFQAGVLQQIEHFGEYFGKGMVSSFVGGVYNMIPYIIYLGYLAIIDRNFRLRNGNADQDHIYVYLRKFSFFSIIFIPASIYIQVFGHRYVFPFIIIWMIYFLYMIKDLSPRMKFFKFFYISLIHLLVAFFFYVLPNYILGESHFEEELIRSLKSIPYIDHGFWKI